MWPGSNFKKVLCQNLSFADSRDRFGGSSLNTSKRLPKSDSNSGKKLFLFIAQFCPIRNSTKIYCRARNPYRVFLFFWSAGRQAGRLSARTQLWAQVPWWISSYKFLFLFPMLSYIVTHLRMCLFDLCNICRTFGSQLLRADMQKNLISSSSSNKTTTNSSPPRPPRR